MTFTLLALVAVVGVAALWLFAMGALIDLGTSDPAERAERRPR